MSETITLFRPVGAKELALIEASSFTAFPPRLPEQPIFYPVTNEEYATQIARDWNAKYNADKVGYVTKFEVRKDFLDRYETKIVGGKMHEEYWIPAEDLEEFNRNIVGKLKLLQSSEAMQIDSQKNLAIFSKQSYNFFTIENKTWFTAGLFQMHYKVYDFLYEIGFTDEDIEEFMHIEPDGVDGKGRPFYGNDVIFAVTKTDEKSAELSETGEIIEAYWEKGWVGDCHNFHRANFDSYRGRYYKAFPTRYFLPRFKFTKSLRRVLNKNHDLKYIIRPLRITPEKSDLFDTYNFLRHGKPPEKSLLERYKYIWNDDSKKMELCIFKGNKLVACSFFEAGTFALYGNTAFWDVRETARSLGTLTVLLEIKYALSKNMVYYYLGHFYAQNPNYHYKTRFGGLELFDWDNESWIPFNSPRIKDLLKQKLPRWKSEEDK